MPFHFPLEVVLRLRQSTEHQQELLLIEANLQVTRLDQQIRGLDKQSASSSSRRAHQLETGLKGAELHFELACVSALRARRRELERQLAEAEEVREARAREFREARRQRETMETLHNQQHELHRQHQERQDQRRLDEMLLLRHTYLQRR